jgi:hypothetical protein
MGKKLYKHVSYDAVVMLRHIASTVARLLKEEFEMMLNQGVAA